MQLLNIKSIYDYKYSLHILFNPNKFSYIDNNPYLVNLLREIEPYIIEFLNNCNFGTNICFWFSIYLEDVPNFGNQSQCIIKEDKLIKSSCHFNKSLFISLTIHEQIYTIFQACINMLTSIKHKENIPKYFDIDNAINLFSKYLTNISKYKIDTSNIILLNYNNIRFGFFFDTTIEIINKDFSIYYRLSDHINTITYNNNYGSSIYNFIIALEIFKFDGEFAFFYKDSNNYKRYGHKIKELLFVKQLDGNIYNKLNNDEILSNAKSLIIESLNDYHSLKRRPKDFNFTKYSKDIIEAINCY